MFDKQRRQAQVFSAQFQQLLAPVHLLAIAAPKGRIEGGHLRQIARVQGHAEPDTGRGRRQRKGGGKVAGCGVDNVGGTGDQRAGRADHRDAEQFGVVRHRGDARHTGISQNGCHKPGRPACGHQRIGIEQDHRVTAPGNHGQPCVDRPDEPQIFGILDQGHLTRM